MMRPGTPAVAAALALLLSGPTAFAQKIPPSTTLPGAPTAPGATAKPDTAQKPGTVPPGGAGDAMMQSMDKMLQDMAEVPMTGNPDKDFAAMMIPHHQGAVEMANIELTYGKDPQMRALARAVIAAQNRELTEMKTWQTRHPGK